MVFSDTTVKDGIIQNCETLAKLGDGGITGNSVLFAKFTGWINEAYGKVVMAIMTVDKNWRWDDFNWTNPNAFPVATALLVSGQRDYLLPRATNSSDLSTLWKVYKVRMKDTNGEWYDLTPLGSDEDELASDTTGHPTKYRLLAGSVRLSVPPTAAGVTLSAGIQVWFQREFVKFTTSDTTMSPGFMSSYHYLLALDACATYFLPYDLNMANEYIALFRGGLQDLKVSYSQRNDDSNITKRMSPHIEDTR